MWLGRAIRQMAGFASALAFVGGDDSPSGDKETTDAPVVDGVVLPDLDHHPVFRRTDPVCPWSAHSLRLADCSDLIAQHATRRWSHRSLSHSQRRESDLAMAARGTAVRRGSLPPIHEPLAPGQRGGPHDTITGHDSLASRSRMLRRMAIPAFQAACRGFEPRLPLHILTLAAPAGPDHDLERPVARRRPATVASSTPAAAASSPATRRSVDVVAGASRVEVGGSVGLGDRTTWLGRGVGAAGPACSKVRSIATSAMTSSRSCVESRTARTPVAAASTTS